MHLESQPARQTNRQTDRQTERQADKMIERDRHASRWMDWMDVQTQREIDR